MQALRLLVVLLATVHADNVVSNPLGKTIELLNSLSAKVTADGEREAEAYKKFAHWCKVKSANLNNEIKVGNARDEKLTAKIGDAAANIEACNGKIDDLSAAIATGEADLKSATEIRAKEAADFAAAEAELVEGVDTLSRALGVLSREMAKNPAMFTQLDSSNVQDVLSALQTVMNSAAITSTDQKSLIALVQSNQGSEDSDVGAPAADVYKSHSKNILDVIEDMKEKAEGQLADLRKAESNTKHNFEMLKQSLEDQVAQDNKNLNEQKNEKLANTEAKSVAEGNLAQTKKDVAEAEKSLEDTTEDCAATKANHEATVAARNEELKVLADAIKILEQTTAGASSQTYSFMQVVSKSNLVNSEVVDMIKKLGSEYHEASLTQLASRISAVARFGDKDPFAKVKKLISDMISKLEAEAGAEAKEKAYCDEEMAKTEAKRDDHHATIDRLTVKIDQAAAQSAALKATVKEDQGELAALAREQAEMDKIRQEQHADYVTAKADLEQGLVGVRQALQVLRDYYAKQEESLIQQPQPAHPDTFSKSDGAGNSIIGILEVTESDFASNLAKEELEEETSAEEYEKQTQENAILKTMKEQDVKYNTQEFMGLDKDISQLTGDRTSENAELDAVMEYYGKLRERCIAKPETYENRKNRRAAEIAGLKEALNILENEAAFMQRKRRGSFRGVVQP